MFATDFGITSRSRNPVLARIYFRGIPLLGFVGLLQSLHELDVHKGENRTLLL
jgi:hypothetical protein